MYSPYHERLVIMSHMLGFLLACFGDGSDGIRSSSPSLNVTSWMCLC
jgi:hypothetical protein